jgi:thioredoxin 1
MELAKKCRVMSIPTLMIFKNGELAKKTMGAMSKDDLLEFIYE